MSLVGYHDDDRMNRHKSTFLIEFARYFSVIQFVFGTFFVAIALYTLDHSKKKCQAYITLSLLISMQMNAKSVELSGFEFAIHFNTAVLYHNDNCVEEAAAAAAENRQIPSERLCLAIIK